MEVRTFENEYTKMRIENGILFISYNPNLNITLDIAKQCVNERLKLCEGKSYPVVSVLNNIKEPDKSVKKFLSSKEAMKGIKAGAFVVDSHLFRLIASIFIALYVNFSKTTPPTKLFSNKEKAIEWAKQFSETSEE